MLLSEAERLGLLKKKTPYKPEKKEQLNKLRKEQAEYLHPKILESEAKSPFKVKIFPFLMNVSVLSRRHRRGQGQEGSVRREHRLDS